MTNTEVVWLIEISLKDFEPNLPGGTRIVSFEEVVASDEIVARQTGYEQFAARCFYEPIMRRKMYNWGITQHNCRVSDAVQLAAAPKPEGE